MWERASSEPVGPVELANFAMKTFKITTIYWRLGNQNSAIESLLQIPTIVSNLCNRFEFHVSCRNFLTSKRESMIEGSGVGWGRKRGKRGSVSRWRLASLVTW